MLLLSERRSLSPVTRRYEGTNRRLRLSQVGDHSYYHRNSQDLDVDAATSGERSPKRAPFSRRTTLPENIKPMQQNENESNIMEAGAMRYLPQILRDIYAQRQRRRPSEVSFFADEAQLILLSQLNNQLLF